MYFYPTVFYKLFQNHINEVMYGGKVFSNVYIVAATDLQSEFGVTTTNTTNYTTMTSRDYVLAK